jgi:peptide deformylase
MRKEYIKMIYESCEQFERLLNNDEGVLSVDDNLQLLAKCKWVLMEEMQKKQSQQIALNSSNYLKGLKNGKL